MLIQRRRRPVGHVFADVLAFIFLTFILSVLLAFLGRVLVTRVFVAFRCEILLCHLES